MTKIGSCISRNQQSFVKRNWVTIINISRCEKCVQSIIEYKLHDSNMTIKTITLEISLQYKSRINVMKFYCKCNFQKQIFSLDIHSKDIHFRYSFQNTFSIISKSRNRCDKVWYNPILKSTFFSWLNIAFFLRPWAQT